MGKRVFEMVVAGAVILAFTVCAGWAAGKATPKKPEVQTQTIQGEVVAVKKAKGKVVTVVIKSDGDQYIVKGRSKAAKEIAKYVGKKVEATGVIKESRKKKYITLKEFKEITQ